MEFKNGLFLALVAASSTLFALPPPTNAPSTVLTPLTEYTQSALTVKVNSLDLAKLSSDALDIYRKNNQPGYIGWYDLVSKSFSGTYTSNYPQDTIMGAADVAREAVIKNNPAYVKGIVTILDSQGTPKAKIIFIGGNGQPDLNSATAFVQVVQASGDAAK